PDAIRVTLLAGRAPLAAVFRFRSLDLHENRPTRLARIVHHFRMGTESCLRVGDAIGCLVVDGLRERAAATLRAVRVQYADAAAWIDSEVEDVANVLVLKHFLRAADLLPDNDVLVLEKLGRTLPRKLRRVFLRRCAIALCRADCDGPHHCQSPTAAPHSPTTIATVHDAPPRKNEERSFATTAALAHAQRTGS